MKASEVACPVFACCPITMKRNCQFTLLVEIAVASMRSRLRGAFNLTSRPVAASVQACLFLLCAEVSLGGHHVFSYFYSLGCHMLRKLSDKLTVSAVVLTPGTAALGVLCPATGPSTCAVVLFTEESMSAFVRL